MQLFHAPAYLTDPTIINRNRTGLHKDQGKNTEQWLEDNYLEFITGLIYYRLKDNDIFQASMFNIWLSLE